MRLKGEKQPKRLLSTEFRVFIVLTLLSASTLVISTRNIAADFRGFGLSLFSGLRGGIHGVSSFVSRTVLSVQELTKLRREYHELTQRIARYEQLERSAAEIRQENNRLREQLGFSQTILYRHIPAEVIGRDPDNLFSALVINKGSFSGVENDMPVIAYQNGVQSLVGRVIKAGIFESLVMPLYDTGSFVSSRLAESRYEGITEGRGSPDSPLLMRFISKRAVGETGVGDVVISSGMGGVYPSGINIGRVSRIGYQENEISMELEVNMTLDFSRLEYVFVVDPSASGPDSEPEIKDG